jgi:SAM-dependent methyltransferase
MTTEKDYVLGTHDDEVARLGLQNAVWRPCATDAWRRAGITVGSTVVDLGCGPGYAALDLAEIVGPTGRVIAIDRSRRFLDRLERTAKARDIGWIETYERDLDEGDLPPLEAHAVWTRWVYAFVKHPHRLLEHAVAVLRPGGSVVVHEYGDYRTWRWSPPSVAFEAFVTEVMASWRATGGEPDIGLDLPRWLDEMGLDVHTVNTLVDVARPKDHLWQWPRAFIEVGLQRLVELGRVEAAKARELMDDYARLEQTPGAFQITPLVLEIIARKRRADSVSPPR